MTRSQSLAMYIRIHVTGASVGIRLAELLAADPWTNGELDHLAGELADEIDFARKWAQANSRRAERWLVPLLGFTAAARTGLAAIRPLRGPLRRTVSLEAMRSLVLAKKAMWELGLAVCPADDPLYGQLEEYDRQAMRQSEELQRLHQAAAVETFGS